MSDTKFEDCKTKKARIEFIKSMIQTHNGWLLRGVLAIYRSQTEDEKSSKSTQHNNGVGFNGIDSQYLSSIAERVARRAPLSQKQIDETRRRMVKYAKQLEQIADSKPAQQELK